MANDKILNKLREQFKDLNKELESFKDEDIQPSASDCDSLQEALFAIQEQLAVYKYHKQNHEVSPSFNIHARVSEEIKTASPDPEKKPENTEVPSQKTEAAISELVTGQARNSKLPGPIVIGLNDKFRFINELFSQNPAEYNIAIEQLSGLHSWSEAELYMSSLKSLYTWKENQEVVKLFYGIIKKRFE